MIRTIKLHLTANYIAPQFCELFFYSNSYKCDTKIGLASIFIKFYPEGYGIRQICQDAIHPSISNDE